MNLSVHQKKINSKIYHVSELLRRELRVSDQKDLILFLVFLRYLSDLENNRSPLDFYLPKESNFWYLYEERFNDGNMYRIQNAVSILSYEEDISLKNFFESVGFRFGRSVYNKLQNKILIEIFDIFGSDTFNFFEDGHNSLSLMESTFEYLLKSFYSKNTGGDAEYDTPSEISTLLTNILDPKLGDSICDPACRMGTLLLDCARYIRSKHVSSYYSLSGQEMNVSTLGLAEMNSFIHREYHIQLEAGDSLNNPAFVESNGNLKQFDIVLSNPPFSVTRWSNEDNENDIYGRFVRGMPPKSKGDYAYISHMIKSLNPYTGRMGVIMPHGVLFRGGAEGTIRSQLLKENLLDIVVGLPDKLLKGTSIPIVMLIFRMDKVDKNVLFVDASREFISGRNQNKLTSKDIDKVLKTINVRANVDKYAHVASFEEIQENDYNLNIRRYIADYDESDTEVDISKLCSDRAMFIKELRVLEEEMNNFLSD